MPALPLKNASRTGTLFSLLATTNSLAGRVHEYNASNFGSTGRLLSLFDVTNSPIDIKCLAKTGTSLED